MLKLQFIVIYLFVKVENLSFFYPEKFILLILFILYLCESVNILITHGVNYDKFN